MKRIFCYGDSWTLGMGSEIEPGKGGTLIEIKNSLQFREDHKDYLYSYPGQLQSKLKNTFQVINNGFGGGSNYEIYRMILHHLSPKSPPYERIQPGDIVIVGWTSILREPLSFFYAINENGNTSIVDFSIKAFEGGHNSWYPYWIQEIESEDLKTSFKKSYEDFIINRINYNFLYEQVMNYICQLQIIFESLNIKFLFFNAFENVLNKDVHFYNQIKKENWILPNYTMSDYLCDIEETLDETLPYSVWEDDVKKVERNNDGPHPNRVGYSYITEIIYKKLQEIKCLI